MVNPEKHPFSEFSEMKERLVRRVSAAMAWVTDSYLFGEDYKNYYFNI